MKQFHVFSNFLIEEFWPWAKHLIGCIDQLAKAGCSRIGGRLRDVALNQQKHFSQRGAIAVKFLVHYSSRPMRVFGSLGFLIGGIGFGLGCWLAWLKYGLDQSIATRPLLMLATLLMLGGLQLASLGLLGEMLARIHHGTLASRAYVVREMLSNDG